MVHAWNFHPELVDGAMAKGASGYLSNTLPAHELATAIEAIADGNVVISDAPPRSRSAAGLDWPGRIEGLGPAGFDDFTTWGARLDLADAVEFTHREIHLTCRERQSPGSNVGPVPESVITPLRHRTGVR